MRILLDENVPVDESGTKRGLEASESLIPLLYTGMNAPLNL